MYLKEYFGIDVQMKVIYLEFWILSIQLDLSTYHQCFIIKFET
jgi:hypothetical protein